MHDRSETGDVEADVRDSDRRWQVLRRREIIDARPWLRVFMDDVRLPDGRVIEGFSTVELPDYVNIVALTPDQQVVVTRGYKHAVGRVGYHLPGGYLEPDEEPQAAAQRELLEETGYASGHWESLGAFVVDSNRGCGIGHLYLARAVERIAEPDSGDLEEPEVELLTLQQLWEATRTGELAVIANAAAVGLALVALGGGPSF